MNRTAYIYLLAAMLSLFFKFHAEMKRTFLSLLAMVFIKVADCQTKIVPTQEIDRLWLKELSCIDSSGNKTKFCSVDLNGFQVKFSIAFFDKQTRRLRLVGKLSPPVPEVGIYVSDTNVIELKDAIAYTSYDPKDLDKDGYFDISLIIKPKQSLFFYLPSFYVRQLDLYKLLDKQFQNK